MLVVRVCCAGVVEEGEMMTSVMSCFPQKRFLEIPFNPFFPIPRPQVQFSQLAPGFYLPRPSPRPSPFHPFTRIPQPLPPPTTVPVDTLTEKAIQTCSRCHPPETTPLTLYLSVLLHLRLAARFPRSLWRWLGLLLLLLPGSSFAALD